MAEPQNPDKTINAHDGFARLTAVMSTWAPQRLAQTGNSTRALRAMARRRHK